MDVYELTQAVYQKLISDESEDDDEELNEMLTTLY